MGWLLQCISMSMASAASMSRGAVATRIARSTPVAAIVDCAMPTTTDGIGTLSRRALLALTCATPLSARAGRVEDMLATDTATMLEDPAANAVRGPVARTVQTSKLGVAVRRAVVKSAQFDDALDARWDALSYKLRPKQAPPAPRSPPPPVDLQFAEATRRCGIDACCAAARVSPRTVEDAIAAGRDTYASLYEGKSAFGLETYAAYRAFNSFLKDDVAAERYEAMLGAALLDGPYGAARPPRPAHATQRDLESAIAGCVDILGISKAANLCGQLEVSPPDAEDLADLAGRKAWGDENKDVQNPAPQLQLSAKLIDAAELPPRLMLETQAKRLGLRVLPDATASALRAYLLRCGARPVCEEYFVDDVYRTAFDQDDYSTVQLEVLIN